MAAVRHFTIDDVTAFYAPGLGGVICYAGPTLNHNEFRLDGERHLFVACFRVWCLRGREYLAAVMRNLTPGHYLAEWRFGRLTLDVLVLPNRVTRVDWRAASVGRETDRMVPIAPAAAVPASLSA
jgi:hypothetical protein